MFRYSFAKDAAERAVRTAAQSALAYLGTAGLLNALDVDYAALGGIAAGGALLSVLTSLAATQVAASGTASLVPEANAPVAPGD